MPNKASFQLTEEQAEEIIRLVAPLGSRVSDHIETLKKSGYIKESAIDIFLKNDYKKYDSKQFTHSIDLLIQLQQEIKALLEAKNG